jgi:hypothetical protein
MLSLPARYLKLLDKKDPQNHKQYLLSFTFVSDAGEVAKKKGLLTAIKVALSFGISRVLSLQLHFRVLQ